jgi:hypothetical protein
MLIKSSFIFMWSLWAFQASAQQTYKAASCSQADIQAAITNELASAVDDDIITIPAGTCTWTGTSALTATFTHSVTIQGAGAVSATTGGGATTGTDQTIIMDNLSSGRPGQTIFFAVTPGKVLRVTGFAVVFNSSSITPSQAEIQIASSGNANAAQARVDHMHFNGNNLNNGTYFLFMSTIGVADHNYFESGASMRVEHPNWAGNDNGHGDSSWATAEQWGTNQAFFFEDNLFFNNGIGDMHIGGRIVFRYNTVTENARTSTTTGQMFWHGVADTRNRGGKQAEVYNNTAVQPTNSSCGGCGAANPFWSPNSGTVLFWGNTVTQYRGAVALDYTCRMAPGSANGCNYNYSAPPNGWGACGTAFGPSHWDQTTDSSGYACLDQPGRGVGDFISGQLPNVCNLTLNPSCNVFTGQWPRQALTPTYVWNNTYTASSGYNPTTLVNPLKSIIVDNRDYFMQFGTNAEPGSFDGTAGVGTGTVDPTVSGAYSGAPNCSNGTYPGPGYWNSTTSTLWVCTAANTWTAYYTPYTYPHPLTQSSAAATVTPVAPPTSLKATVN